MRQLGLRSRKTRRHTGGKIGTSTLQRILRDPYYAGWIVYMRGKPDEQIFRGRHDALIDEETGELIARVVGAELTDPYSVLLAEKPGRGRASRGRAVSAAVAQKESDPEGPLSRIHVSSNRRIGGEGGIRTHETG